MAKRSSRKSSSGDEALLWGIAAVVVAIVGVGTAIMLTRNNKPPKPKKTGSRGSRGSRGTGPKPPKPKKTGSRGSRGTGQKPTANMACLPGPGFSNCNILSCSDATIRENCSVGTDESGNDCCVWGQAPKKENFRMRRWRR